MKPILLVAETEKGKMGAVTLELIAAARQLRDFFPGRDEPEILVLVAHDSPMAPARDIGAKTGCRTLGCPWPAPLTPESLKQGLAVILPEIKPSYLMFSHTTMAREVAPALGAKLGAAAISGVTGMGRDAEGPVFSRPVMDNTQVLSLRPPGGALCILTLAPGAFAGRDAAQAGPGGVEEIRLPPNCLTPVTKRQSLTERASGNRAIEGAKIVVGAGQGIGDRDNLGRVKTFAQKLPGACVGASRPLVDRGWMPYSRQVGITGAVVAPELYIACGISGSSQHLAGMAGSKWVVSINKNGQAPICRHSDLCIQADVNEFIDMFLEEE